MKRTKRISPTVVATVLRSVDLAAIILVGLIAFYVRNEHLVFTTRDWLVLIVVTIVSANTFQLYRLYDPRIVTTHPLQLRSLTLAAASVVLAVLVIGYLTKASVEYSRIWMTLWAAGAYAGLVLIRFCLKFRLARWYAKGNLTKRVALVGAGPLGRRLVEHRDQIHDPREMLVGIYDDRQSRIPTQIGEYKVEGTIDDLLSNIHKESIDEVIVALPWSAEKRLQDILLRLRRAPIDVRLCPDGIAYRFAGHPYSERWGVAMLEAYDRPLKNWSGVIKAIEDRILSLLLLLFALPLMLMIAVAIKIDSRGPVLFKQRRYGFSNELIEVYKFRTLHHDQADGDDEKQVTSDDPRVTRVGAMLRATSLDELPQFFNVLRGEMSIVGPRPHARKTKAGGELFENVVREYFARHRVKPGITGWAQVNGWRGETDTKEKIERRVEHDLYYIDHWSVWMDLRIMFMTPFAMVSFTNGRGSLWLRLFGRRRHTF